MTTNQIVQKLQALEERMGARDLLQRVFVLDFVESNEGRPTGKVTRVRWVAGEKTSEEEFWLDPETLLRR
jgi:hypothetical protein